MSQTPTEAIVILNRLLDVINDLLNDRLVVVDEDLSDSRNLSGGERH